jgi:hypothetical protein
LTGSGSRAATLLYEPTRTTTRQPFHEAAMACCARFRGGRSGGDPSMACKKSEVHPCGAPRGASNLPATMPRIASRPTCLLSRPRLATCGVVLWRPAMPGSKCGGRSLHTAEVIGSIPVTPTSTNTCLRFSRAPFASRLLLAARCGGQQQWSGRLALGLPYRRSRAGAGLTRPGQACQTICWHALVTPMRSTVSSRQIC